MSRRDRGHLRVAEPADAERAAAVARIGELERRIGRHATAQLLAGDPEAARALVRGDTVRLYDRLAELAGEGEQ